MPELKPVDHDPFGPQMTSVDYDPFATEKFANPAVKGMIGSLAKLAATPGRVMQPNPYPAGSEEASWYEDQRQKAMGDWAPEMAMTMMGGSGAVPASANELRMGIKAYHGSPHDFDAFSLDKIGTGEGAQAYGHGLYFAENPKVAEEYADTLGKPNISNDDLVSGNYNLGPRGHRYEVNINADPEHFLDWDKPLSEQHPKAREALNSLGLTENVPGDRLLPELENVFARRAIEQHGGDLDKINAAIKPGEYTTRPVEALRDAGIPGVKYLDQGSRASGDGTRNYVVFNDKLIDIVKKYALSGIVLPPAIAAAYEQQFKSVEHDPFKDK